jgi:hypothetical protein
MKPGAGYVSGFLLVIYGLENCKKQSHSDTLN